MAATASAMRGVVAALPSMKLVSRASTIALTTRSGQGIAERGGGGERLDARMAVALVRGSSRRLASSPMAVVTP